MRLRFMAGFVLASLSLAGCDTATDAVPTADSEVEAALATVMSITRSATLKAAVLKASTDHGPLFEENSGVLRMGASEEAFDLLFTAEDQTRIIEASAKILDAYPEMEMMDVQEATTFSYGLIYLGDPDDPESGVMSCANWCDATAAAQMIAVGTAYAVAVMSCGSVASLCMGGAFATMSTAMAAIAVSNTACVAGCNQR